MAYPLSLYDILNFQCLSTFEYDWNFINIRDCQDHIYCFLLLLYTKLMIPDMKYDLVAHYIVKKYLREQQPQL